MHRRVCHSTVCFATGTICSRHLQGLFRPCTACLFLLPRLAHARACQWLVPAFNRVTLYSLAIAYITAVTFPIDTLSDIMPFVLPQGIPTVGLSAVCFSLLGQIAFQVKRKLYYQVWVLSFVAIGFMLPSLCSVCGYIIAAPNNILHLYCYVVGLLVGFLNSPAHEKK